MKIALSYIAIPILFSVGVCIYAYMKNENKLNELFSLFVYGGMFYCAPYFILAIAHMIIKPSSLTIHAGYIGATISLLFIASLWVLPSDPSGLPMQWMAYWPIAGILMVILSGITHFFSKWKNS